MKYVECEKGGMKNWKTAWIYFTENRIIGVVSFIGEQIVIPYKNVREIAKCFQGFFPMGIAITYQAPKSGELVKEKFSVNGRAKILAFLEEKTGISVNA